MIKDISIGQYFPGNSLIHKLDARVKLITVFVYIVTLFLAKSFFALGILTLAVLLCIGLSKIPLKVMVKGLRALVFIVLFTAFMQIFYNDEGTVLLKPFENHDFVITTGGIYSAVFIVVRILSLVLISSLLTYTTSPTMLTDAIERLLSPLRFLHINVHAFAMMMTIALRFIPTLIEEVDIIMSAQKARGAMLEAGSLTERAKALIPVFVPLFVSSFRRAVDLAFAMECRCYSGDGKRTRMKVMKLQGRDYITCAVFFVFTAGVLFTVFYDFGDMFLFRSVI